VTIDDFVRRHVADLLVDGDYRAFSIDDRREPDIVRRDQLEEAILTLERLARGRGRRRGRPPAWMTELKRRGRPPGSKNKPKDSAAA